MTIEYYYALGSPPCHTVNMALEAFNLKPNMIKVETMKGEQNTPQIEKLNPTMTMPTLVDDGFPLWESRTILRYLANKYGKNSTLYPEDLRTRALIDLRLDFDLGSLYNDFRKYFYPQVTEKTPPNQVLYEKLMKTIGQLDKQLEGNKYAVGDNLTIADFSLLASISCMETLDLVKFDELPNIKRWYALAKSTVPGYDQVEKGNQLFKSVVDEMLKK